MGAAMRLTAVKTGKNPRHINELSIIGVGVRRGGMCSYSVTDDAMLTAVKTGENKRRINPLGSTGGC